VGIVVGQGILAAIWPSSRVWTKWPVGILEVEMRFRFRIRLLFWSALAVISGISGRLASGYAWWARHIGRSRWLVVKWKMADLDRKMENETKQATIMRRERF
jgi:hypothetical protein